jgi:hypothetical protein
MAGRCNDFLRIQHPRLSAQDVLALAIVEASRTAGDNQHDAIANPDANRLGDLRRIDAMGFGGQCHGCGTGLRLYDGNIGSLLAEEGANGF